MPLASALDRALAGGDLPEPARIGVECLTAEGFYETWLYGSGVGIWQQRAQLTLAPGELGELLALFRRQGFVALEETYGGKSDPKTPQDPTAAAIRVVCSVALTLGSESQRVTQLEGGRQSAELRALAEEILARVAARGEAGVRAASLDDGLAMVAAGELAPEAIDLSFHHQRDAAPDLLLRVRHGRVTVRRELPAGGYGDEGSRALAPATASHLAATLRAADLPALPFNLYSADYVDLRAGVLDHERAIQARAFAGMDAATSGAAQGAFDHLVGELDALAADVAGEAR